MQSVVTLIGSSAQTLSDGIVGDVRAALNALGAETAQPDWLAEGIACDIAFDGLSADQAEAAARMAMGDAALDVIAQSSEHRRKSLLLADMDSTMVTSETLDDLADFVGLKTEIAAITARAMNGELDFADALRERVGMLKGLAETALADTWEQIELSAGAETCVKTMAAHGTHCVLISGGFTFFTQKVAEICGFHESYANDFVIDGGKLTGSVVEPILTKDVKLKTLIDTAAAKGLSMVQTLTVGDGANDLPMLQAASLGVAYRGKPSVRDAAPARLDHADLTGLLYAQGYREEAFVQ